MITKIIKKVKLSLKAQKKIVLGLKHILEKNYLKELVVFQSCMHFFPGWIYAFCPEALQLLQAADAGADKLCVALPKVGTAVKGAATSSS